MKSVYLAGAIAGCDFNEANGWRRAMIQRLAKHNIRGISPLRCEPLIGTRYGVSYEDPRFGTARAIASKNMADVRMCDMTLCFMPKTLNERRFSMGTLIELAWAHAHQKPTILVSDYDFITEHPVVQANASWILDSLDEAYEVIVGILGDYSKAAALICPTC